jgi:Rrf2 family cysteine metabolism transcriptional repressor
MVLISQKCRYALRAVFELGFSNSDSPVKTAQIAEAQHIPVRFLEVIMAQLRQGGFVDSRRGKSGGYVLTRQADTITVGEIIEFIQGPIDVTASKIDKRLGARGDHAFGELWLNVTDAISDVYANTTFDELIKNEKLAQKQYVPNYSI